MDLEKVEAFYGFLDFLSNPKEFKVLIEEAKKENQERRDLIEKQRRIKNIDEWRISEEQKLQDRQASLDQAIESHEKKSKHLAKRIEEFNSQMIQKNHELNDKKESIDQREKAVGDLEKERQKIDKLRQEYELKLSNIQKERDQLNQTMESIRIAAGG